MIFKTDSCGFFVISGEFSESDDLLQPFWLHELAKCEERRGRC